jgi:LCP family protein required for cell wall assembly
MLATASTLILVVSGLAWWTTKTMLSDVTISHAAGTSSYPHTEGPITVLLIGLDSRKDLDGNDLPATVLDRLHAGDSDSGGYNTNTLILARIGIDDRVTAFSIPRDDYVAVTGIPGYDHIKIKEAYGLAKADAEQHMVDGGDGDSADLERRGRDAGRTATLAAVRDLTGVTPDYFAEVNLFGFYQLAQALGGVDVCLNAPVQDDYSGADFPAGPQRLDAAQSLAFVRQRHGLTNGDIDRTHRQQAFLSSVLNQLDSAGTFTDFSKLGRLLDVVRRNIVLSSGWTPEVFARIGDVAHARAAEYRTLPVVRYDEIDGSDVNIIDAAAIKAQVTAAFTDRHDAPPSPRATVDVFNATSREGLAAKVSKALMAKGFGAGELGTDPPSDSTTTTITYASGAESDARAVANLLHVDSINPDDRVPAGHVIVTLGSNFDAGPLGSPPSDGSEASPVTASDAAASTTSSDGPTDTSCVD